MQQLADDAKQHCGRVQVDGHFRAEMFADDFNVGLSGHLIGQSINCWPEAEFVKRCRAEFDHQVAG